MNCAACLAQPPGRQSCDAYPQGWPECGGRICRDGMPKHDDLDDPREGEKMQAEYIERLKNIVASYYLGLE